MQRWHGLASLQRRWLDEQVRQARETRVADTADEADVEFDRSEAAPLLRVLPAVDAASVRASWPAAWRFKRSLHCQEETCLNKGGEETYALANALVQTWQR